MIMEFPQVSLYKVAREREVLASTLKLLSPLPNLGQATENDDDDDGCVQ